MDPSLPRLSSCFHCRNQPVLQGQIDAFYVECGCGLRTKEFPSGAEAVTFWNATLDSIWDVALDLAPSQ